MVAPTKIIAGLGMSLGIHVLDVPEATGAYIVESFCLAQNSANYNLVRQFVQMSAWVRREIHTKCNLSVLVGVQQIANTHRERWPILYLVKT